MATDSTTVRIGVFALARKAISELVGFPVATLVALGLSTLLGWLLSFVAVDGFIAASILLLLGTITSNALVMALVMFRVMDEDDLPDLARIVKVLVVFAVVFGAAVSLPMIVAAYFVPEAVWQRFMVGWLPDQVPFLFSSLGPVLLMGMVPAMLVAWPIVARHDTGLIQSVGYVWQWIENKRYNAIEVTAGVAGVCALMCFIPYASLLVLPFIMHFSKVVFDAVSDDIIVKAD